MTKEDFIKQYEELLKEAVYLYCYYPNRFRLEPELYFREEYELLEYMKREQNK